MVTYPQKFHGEAQASPGIKGTWETTAADHRAECAVPKIYEGTGEAFSPEEFFLLSIQNCFVASFKVYAEHLDLDYQGLKVSADLIVDIENEKGPVMKSVELHIALEGVTDRDQAEEIVARSLKDGFIFNSIKTEIKTAIEYL